MRPSKHKFPARLTTAQLDTLTNDKRKEEVTKVKRDIQAMTEEKKRQAVEAKESNGRQEAQKRTEQCATRLEDQDQARDSELGQDSETVRRPSQS